LHYATLYNLVKIQSVKCVGAVEKVIKGRSADDSIVGLKQDWLA
jgi:hypothetical protein